MITISVLLSVFFFQVLPYANQWDRDSPSFYTAAKGITKKIDIYDWEEFQTLADSIFGKSEKIYPYVYLPVLAQIFIPLTLLDFPDYFLFLFIFNILLTFITIFLIYRLLELRKEETQLPLVFLFLIMLGNIPLLTTIDYGQINILVFDLILLSMVLLKTDKKFISSFLLCLAIFLKIYPALFLVFFFFQKKYRYILYSLINFAIILFLSVIIFSPSLWNGFLNMFLNNFFSGEKSNAFFDFGAHMNNCSLNGFLSQLFIGYGLPRACVFPTIILLLIILFFLFKSKIKELITWENHNLNISIILILILILSTISWIHHYVIMLFPVAYLFKRIIQERRYIYIIPFSLLLFFIMYYPPWGGFPFNQIRLMSIVALLFLTAYYDFSKRPRQLSHLKIIK
ncbi:MAG: DUF2029 domain-containing protein [Candidatus Aminicenantes bacterium]|nr:MAG: DUF2029 domain-containing protein [Candidatus Aminicenantes bacterium]